MYIYIWYIYVYIYMRYFWVILVWYSECSNCNTAYVPISKASSTTPDRGQTAGLSYCLPHWAHAHPQGHLWRPGIGHRGSTKGPQGTPREAKRIEFDKNPRKIWWWNTGSHWFSHFLGGARLEDVVLFFLDYWDGNFKVFHLSFHGRMPQILGMFDPSRSVLLARQSLTEAEQLGLNEDFLAETLKARNDWFTLTALMSLLRCCKRKSMDNCQMLLFDIVKPRATQPSNLAGEKEGWSCCNFCPVYLSDCC